MIDANQITSRLRMMSDAELQRFAEMHKQDPYMFPLAFNESNTRKQLRMKGQAQAQTPQPPVNQQALAAMRPQQLPEDQGIGALNPEMQFADGGLVAFAGGGSLGEYEYAPVLGDNGEEMVSYADGGAVGFARGGDPEDSVGTSFGVPIRPPRTVYTREQARDLSNPPYGGGPGFFASAAEKQEFKENPAAWYARKNAEANAMPPATANVKGAGFSEAPASATPGYAPANLMDTTTSAGFVPSAQQPKTEAPPPAPEITGDVVWPRMLQMESRGQQFNPRTGAPITSPKGAVGIAQLMPGTAKDAAKMAGVEWDPELFYRARTGDAAKDAESREYNLKLGKAYYDAQLQKYGDPIKAAAAYNMGPGALDRVLADPKKRDTWTSYIPDETKKYVAGASAAGATTAAAPRTAAGITPLAAAPAPSEGYTAEDIDYLSKKYSNVPKTEELFAKRIKDLEAAEAEREKQYQANRPAPEDFAERRAVLEEGKEDVGKQQQLNEGLAWLTFASRMVQPGKTFIQSLVEGASAGTEQYSKAQSELKKAERERKLGLAALSEAQRAAKSGDYEKQQARLDAAATRVENAKNAQTAAVALAYDTTNKGALELTKAVMEQQGAKERAELAVQSQELGRKEQEKILEMRQMADLQKRIEDDWNDLTIRAQIQASNPGIKTLDDYRAYRLQSRGLATLPPTSVTSQFKFETPGKS